MTYLGVGPQPRLTWGATPENIDRTMPGDDLVSNVDLLSTRAISIDVPPSCIWPRLVQMGSGKGGVYTYSIPEPEKWATSSSWAPGCG